MQDANETQGFDALKKHRISDEITTADIGGSAAMARFVRVLPVRAFHSERRRFWKLPLLNQATKEEVEPTFQFFHVAANVCYHG